MEDDIDVLSHGNHDYHDDASYPRSDNLSQMHISFTQNEKDGSLHALTTAYSDLKKRYRELESRNTILRQTITDMENQRITNSRPASANFGGAAGPSSGHAAQGAEIEQAQTRAELSYAQNLERQLLRAKTSWTKAESEKNEWQRKAEAFDRDLKRIQTLVRDKDKRIEHLESDLRVRGHVTSGAQDATMATDKRASEKEIVALQEKNDSLQSELKQLKLFNESLQSRCVALEKQDKESSKQGQLSMSLSDNDERFIVDQMEKYRIMIRNLKEQVSQQGDMLQRQKGAIKRLIGKCYSGVTSRDLLVSAIAECHQQTYW